MTEATPFLPGLSPVAGKSLTAARDAGNLTSNGGLVVLREAANRSGLADVVAASLPDPRNQLLVIHSYRAMVTARMMCIAAGYPDADDLDALRHDPALLIACNRAGGRPRHSEPADHLAAGERCRRQVALPHRHRLHRLLLPQLRDAAQIHRAGHRRHG